MKIAVIDGQGGGLGKSIVERIRAQSRDDIQIIALGTNSLATSNMIRAGSNFGATGENSVKIMSQKVDVIVGPIAILISNSMMGEITPQMAKAISDSSARKILLPLNRCNVYIAGTQELNVNQMIDSAIEELNKLKD
jgi:NAD(P)-dependent dehydrogenase (short-subunit alcohol dehydrogenase family)